MKRFILLVEENPDDEALTLRMFEKHHVSNEVMVFHDGVAAVDFLLPQAHDANSGSPLPELVLLAVKLPRVSGIDVLRKIREHERTKLLPVLVLTSSDEEKRIVEQSQPRGPTSYIRKPVDFAQLTKAVRDVGLSWELLNSSSA